MPRITYGDPAPCHKCGEKDNLFAAHGFGAKIVCPCGEEGPFIGGREYQSEEYNAVFAWNRKQRDAAANLK